MSIIAAVLTALAVIIGAVMIVILIPIRARSAKLSSNHEQGVP